MTSVRLRDPRLLPVLAGAAMCFLAVQEGLLDPDFRRSLDRVVLVAAWLAVAFAVTTLRPSLGAVAVAAYFPVGLVVGAPGPGGAGLLSVLFACAWAGYADPPRRSRWGVAGAVAVCVATNVAASGSAWDNIFFPAVFVPAWWTGTLVRREQERSRQLVELAAALEAEREASAAAAAVAERTRIAREVHDAVAHSVSVMTLQVGGLRRQLHDVLVDRPAEREVMLGLERLGRESVEELRSLVGILRERPTEGAAAPAPSLARAEDLVTDVRAAGLPVRLEVEGEPVELPRALDVSAYRVLQEALTNVLRHAGGSPTRVVLRYAADAVTVEVVDEGPRGRVLVPAARTAAEQAEGQAGGPAGRAVGRSVGGHGLVGMRERVALYGGTLDAGPRRGGGFAVRARFPLARRWS